MPQYREGQTATRADGSKLVFQQGAWRSMDSSLPPGAKARPDYGQGAFETSDGAIMQAGKSGAPRQLRAAPVAGADSRPRMELGLDQAIAAQKAMYEEEIGYNPALHLQNAGAARTNPNDSLQGVVYNWLADGQREHPIRNMVGKAIGGGRVQRYNQAASTYEAAVLPILSGANITPSEAPRQVKALMPEPGDSPEILKRKSINRAMQLNGISKSLGRPLPFPAVGVMPMPGPASSGGQASKPAALTIDINGNVLK